jgi:hypothetical protein
MEQEYKARVRLEDNRAYIDRVVPEGIVDSRVKTFNEASLEIARCVQALHIEAGSDPNLTIKTSFTSRHRSV